MNDLTSAPTAAGESIEIIGHRGASFDAPENTLASIKLAWWQQADAVEIDVFLSKDEHIVAIHDESTLRLAGRDKAVREQTLSELESLDVGRWKGEQWAGERIPTLNEVLETLPQGKRLFIEVKCGSEIVGVLKSVLRESNIPPVQTAVIGYSLETLRLIKHESPELPVYWVADQASGPQTGRWEPPVGELIQQAKTAGFDGLDLECTPGLDAGAVAEIKRAGLGIFAWTVNSPADARRLEAAGVDGVATDHPGALREWLRQETC